MKKIFSPLLLAACFLVATANAQTITTIAGNHTTGYAGNGGPATAATLNHPNMAHFDKNGNLYFTDYENYVIRKITTSGIISTVAGSGTPGYSGDGGPATAAQLNGASDLAIDSAGNIYITEANNHCVRKVNSAGIITTYAGTGTLGYSGDGGRADSAQLFQPFGCALDAHNNLYIAEIGNNCIRKVSNAGIISTLTGGGTSSFGFAGDGGVATAAKVKDPYAVAIDKNGNVYFADVLNQRIRMVNGAGIISTVCGVGTHGFSGDGGQATAAELNFPYAVAVDTFGNLYITDNANLRIRKVSATGLITTIVGTGVIDYTGDGGPGTNATLNNPTGVEVKANGDLFICDYGNSVIRRVGDTGHQNLEEQTKILQNPSFTVFPNPAHEMLSFEAAAITGNYIDIQVFDAAGRSLLQKTVMGKNGIFHGSIDIVHLPAGQYILSATTGGGVITSQFIKE